MVTVGIFAACLSIWGYSILLNRSFNLSFAYAPITSVMSLMILLYVAIVFSAFSIALPLLFFTGIGLFLVNSAVFCLKQPRSFNNKHFVKPALFILLIMLLILSALGKVYNYTDDYACWGMFAKYIYYAQALPVTDTFLVHPYFGYLPGVALIQNIVFYATQHHSMFLGYFGRGLIIVSGFVIVARGLRLSQALYLCFVLYILMNLFFGQFVSKLQVDALLGFTIFMALFIYHDETAGKLLRVAVATLLLCAMYLIKQSGMIFSIFLLLYFLLDVICFSHKNRIQAVLIIILGFILLFGLHYLQTIYLKHPSVSFNQQHPLQVLSQFSIVDLLHAMIKPLLKLVLGPTGALKLPYILWFVAQAYFMWCFVSERKHKRKARFFVITAIILLIVYALSLVLFEIAEFGVHHSSSSINRYFNQFFAGIFSFFFILFLRQKLIKKTFLNKWVALIFVMLFAMFFVLHDLHHNRYWRSLYQRVDQQTQVVHVKKSHPKICIISKDAVYLLMMRYSLLGKVPLNAKIKTLPACDHQCMNTCDLRIKDTHL